MMGWQTEQGLAPYMENFSVNVLDYFPSTIGRDFFSTICGDLLGSGIGRHVYECAINPRWVIKFEVGMRSFQNVAEWELWDHVRYRDELAKWFAPCVQISPCGMVLIQQRTSKLRGPEEMPEHVPNWMTDLKESNWGFYEGIPVLHDYGHTRLTEFALRGKPKLITHPTRQSQIDNTGRPLDYVSKKPVPAQKPEGQVPGQKPAAEQPVPGEGG